MTFDVTKGHQHGAVCHAMHTSLLISHLW